MEVALKADTDRTAEKAWQKLTRGQYDSTNFCWNIQSTVARVMLLALKFQRIFSWNQFMKFGEKVM